MTVDSYIHNATHHIKRVLAGRHALLEGAVKRWKRSTYEKGSLVEGRYELLRAPTGAGIVLAPGYAASDKLIGEIQDFVKERTAPYKYPREIEFLDELPRNATGKVLKKDLRARESETSA